MKTFVSLGSGRSAWVKVVALIVLAAGIGIRAYSITSLELWVDEAESSINALSILEHGYPTAEYAGIPIFENMLTRQWPGHPEYEFKDISYSDRGMAVYHGWLPLYAIAASFKLFGVEPAKPEPGWQIETTADEMRRRTIAARLPALVSTAIFLVLMFLAARRLCGDDAALSALVITGLSSSVIQPTLCARYYAPMLALNAAGVVTLWRTLRNGRARDYAVHAAVLVLLFYTHTMTFAAVVALTTVMTLLHWGWGKPLGRWVAALVVVAACAAPWLILTGYVQHLRFMPSGLALIRFPDDLFHYLSDRMAYAALFCAGSLWLTLAWIRHGAALPGRLREPWQQHRLQYTMLLSWIAIVTAAYFLASPAASLFPQRLSLMLFVPGFLFMSMSLADGARTISRSLSICITPALALAFLGVSGVLHLPGRDPDAFARLERVFKAVNSFGLAPDARVYASPSSNHTLTFYSGKPIQSLAPVRKPFLDSYPGEVLYIEQRFNWELTAPTDEEVRKAARELGESLSESEVEALRTALASRYPRERTVALGVAVEPPLEPLSPLAAATMRRTRVRAETGGDLEELDWASRGLPFARGFQIRKEADLWQTFFYRLVDPPARSGEHLNAAARLRRGTAYFPSLTGRVFFYSPSPPIPVRQYTDSGGPALFSGAPAP